MKQAKVPKIEPYYLPFPDAARFLGYGLKAFRNALSAGRFPFKPSYFGGKPLFALTKLREFAESLESQSSARPRGGDRRRNSEDTAKGQLTNESD